MKKIDKDILERIFIAVSWFIIGLFIGLIIGVSL